MLAQEKDEVRGGGRGGEERGTVQRMVAGGVGMTSRRTRVQIVKVQSSAVQCSQGGQLLPFDLQCASSASAFTPALF